MAVSTDAKAAYAKAAAAVTASTHAAELLADKDARKPAATASDAAADSSSTVIVRSSDGKLHNVTYNSTERTVDISLAE